MLIIGNLEISWFAVFTAVACFIGVCIACLLRFVQRKDINDIFTCVAFGIPLGLVFGRILYIIFSGSGLTGLGQYLNLTNGGFGLYGVFFGVFLGALIAVRYFYADGLGSLLDCLSIGGAFAITVGRFATGFTPAEIGYEVDLLLSSVSVCGSLFTAKETATKTQSPARPHCLCFHFTALIRSLWTVCAPIR